MISATNPPVVTVSQVNRVVGMIIKADKRLQYVAVRGEISNFTRHYKTGHLYFSLKDEQAQLKAVMFAGNAAKIAFSPEDGARVICRGTITVYEPSGVYQINVTDMQPDGAGEQAVALEELKKRLSAEGIFSQKRPLPQLPRKIAVITSLGGAALQDIINIISRRYPLVKLAVIPALVQGTGAAESVADSLHKAQGCGADLIIFGRGGGSAEDLAAFNTELVARAVYESRIPTISAVGHETDFSIADLAADMRAPTPSAAAELAVPEVSQILAAVDGVNQRALSFVRRTISRSESELYSRTEVIRALSPQNRIAARQQHLESLAERIRRSQHAKIDRAERALYTSAGVISALNPLGVLSRGYSVTYCGGKILTDPNEANVGEKLKITLAKGELSAIVCSDSEN